MKCIDCPDYKMCRSAYDLRIIREKCEKAKWRKSITNYDRIISKSPEELADWIIGVIQRGRAIPYGGTGTTLDWLKQEAKEGE